MAHTIRHVVALMVENRSFDHMLGHMKAPDYDIEGRTGHETKLKFRATRCHFR